MKKNGFIRRLFRNFTHKTLAVILAVAFWYIVQGEQVLELNRRIQVTINVPDGFMIKGPTTRYKDITLRGPRVLLSEFSTRPIDAQLNLPKGRPGTYRFRIDKRYIRNWNDRIKVTVHDAFLDITMDEKLTRTLPIKEQLKGVTADSRLIEKVTIQPSTVQVTGLKKNVSRLKHVLTESIDISSLQQTTSFEVFLNKEQIAGALLGIDKVIVNLQIGEQKINKRFTNIPVEVMKKGEKYSVSPRFVSIVVQGTPGVLSFIKRKNLSAFLDIQELSPGVYEKKIQVKIPANTVLIETVPEMAQVEIYKLN